MANKKVNLKVQGYELDWIEQAKMKQERGSVIDDGTLLTLGQILIDGVDL